MHITEITQNGISYVSDQAVSNIGVPQGSILGALLFLIYINDLPDALRAFKDSTHIVIYADDTNIIVKGKKILNLLFDVFTTFSKWCLVNKLIINFDKTCIINFTPFNIFFESFKFNDVVIKVVNNNKYLGIIIDEKLKWASQICMLCKKLNSQVFLMRKLVRMVDKKTAIIFYYSNFQSKIGYGLTLWGESPLTETVLLTQKKMLRIMDGKRLDYPCKKLLIKYGILTVYNLYVYELIKMAMKNGFLCSTEMQPEHNYNTRHNFHNQKKIKRAESRMCQNKAIELFNNFSETLKHIFKEGGPAIFLTALKKKLQENPYYSLRELKVNPI